MRCFNLAVAAILLVAITSKAGAQCFLCDEVVVMDKPGAECFLSGFEAYHSAITAGAETVEVDIGCDNKADENLNRGGIEVMPRFSQRKPQRKIFTFDETYLICLRELLEPVRDKIDPTIEFDLAVDCRN